MLEVVHTYPGQPSLLVWRWYSNLLLGRPQATLSDPSLLLHLAIRQPSRIKSWPKDAYWGKKAIRAPEEPHDQATCSSRSHQSTQYGHILIDPLKASLTCIEYLTYLTIPNLSNLTTLSKQYTQRASCFHHYCVAHWKLACCHFPASQESILSLLLAQEKIKIWRTVSTKHISPWHNHHVENS